MTQSTQELIDQHRMHSHLFSQHGTPTVVLAKCDKEMSRIESVLHARAAEQLDLLALQYISLLQGRA